MSSTLLHLLLPPVFASNFFGLSEAITSFQISFPLYCPLTLTPDLENKSFDSSAFVYTLLVPSAVSQLLIYCYTYIQFISSEHAF